MFKLVGHTIYWKFLQIRNSLFYFLFFFSKYEIWYLQQLLMSIFYYCVCIIIYSTIYIFFNIWNLIIIVVICLTTLYFYFHFSIFFFQFNINAPFVLMENLMWRYFFSFSCVWKKNGLKEIGQNLATKLVITLGYNLIQYLFIGDEFW